MEQIKWVDRKFSFGYSKNYLPFFIERLRGTASRLEELLKSTDEKDASEKVNGEWSIKEHIGHLSDLESLHGGRIEDLKAGIPVLRAADMSNKKTSEANHNLKSIPELLFSFRNRRNKFIDTVITLDEIYSDRKSLHPRLQQSVTLTDLLFFMAEHDNHHLTRISQLIYF